jgi:cyclase
MSLAIRIIPTLLKRDHSLVKGRQFDSWRVVGHPLQAAKIHAARGVDELMLLDIGATPMTKGPDFRMVEKLTADCFMPVTVGGGVSRVEHVRDLLLAGADKVLVNTHAKSVVSPAADKFGSQAICVGIDVLGKKVAIRCGQESTAWDPASWAEKMVKAGAGEILLQRIERDGMLGGYDVDLIKAVSDAVDIPVIASCGCGSYGDMVSAVKAGAQGVAAGAFFQFTDHTPKGAAEHFMQAGIEARMP